MPGPKKRRLPLGKQNDIMSMFKKVKHDTNKVDEVTEVIEINQEDISNNENAEKKSNSKDSRNFQGRWLKLWPWLELIDGKMYCRECKVAKKHNTFTTGCETFKTSSMSRHEKTDDHSSHKAVAPMQVAMNIATNNAHSENDKSIIKAMKIVYWMAMENLPLSKFESFMNLMKNIEVPGIGTIKVGNSNRIDYESYYSANEFLEAISNTIDDDINETLGKSPCVTIFADESTDISNTKRMTLTARVIDPLTCIPVSLYLTDIEYSDGTGAGLTENITDELRRRNIPFTKLMGFGSDGAAVMTSNVKGVKGRLKELNPHMLHVHCMAHRLALCTSQAACSIPQLKKFQEWMTSLFYYFKASPTRESEVKKIQAILDHPILKYKEIHAVRWLSFYEGLEAIFRTVDPLLTYLHNRQADKDAKANGLLKQMATVQFMYVLYLMMDVMPIVSKLCLTFQKEDLDIAKAKIALDLCLVDLESYKNGTSLFTTRMETFETDVPMVDGHREFKGHRLTSDNTNLTALKSKFLNQLIQNIRSRFPQKNLIEAFFVLAMRTLNFETDWENYGNEGIEVLLKFYGVEQTHNGRLSPLYVSKKAVREQWRTAKMLVKAGSYPVDDMVNLWSLLSSHHRDDLQDLLKLAHLALTVPLHTATCERVFSAQNLILTRQRSRLSPVISDRLLRVRLQGKGLSKHDFSNSLRKFNLRKRLYKQS